MSDKEGINMTFGFLLENEYETNLAEKQKEVYSTSSELHDFGNMNLGQNCFQTKEEIVKE